MCVELNQDLVASDLCVQPPRQQLLEAEAENTAAAAYAIGEKEVRIHDLTARLELQVCRRLTTVTHPSQHTTPVTTHHTRHRHNVIATHDTRHHHHTTPGYQVLVLSEGEPPKFAVIDSSPQVFPLALRSLAHRFFL